MKTEMHDHTHHNHKTKNVAHKSNPAMGMEGHDHHKMMISDFKRRFYITLILTIPIMLLSEMIQNWLGISIQFAGAKYILLLLSTIVYLYGGWHFLKGWLDEIKAKNPGMMFLIGFAISVAYFYSVAIVFGLA